MGPSQQALRRIIRETVMGYGGRGRPSSASSYRCSFLHYLVSSNAPVAWLKGSKQCSAHVSKSGQLGEEHESSEYYSNQSYF